MSFHLLLGLGMITAEAVYLRPSERSLPMIYDCQTYYGSRLDKKYTKNYLLPKETDVYGIFDERNGNLECYTYYERFYPVVRDCPARRIGVKNKGLIFVKNEETSYDNCFDVIEKVVDMATNTQYEYSVDILKDGSESAFAICFKVEVRFMKYLQACPEKYKNYRINPEFFRFRTVSRTSTKNAKFYRSPSVEQYEHLKAINYSFFVDEYDYSSHENEYDANLSDYIKI